MLLGQVLEVSALTLWSASRSIQSTSQCWTNRQSVTAGDWGGGESLGDPDCTDKKLESKLSL